MRDREKDRGHDQMLVSVFTEDYSQCQWVPSVVLPSSLISKSLEKIKHQCDMFLQLSCGHTEIVQAIETAHKHTPLASL